MHVLLTGGAGFIGANLVAHLLGIGGYRVRVLDNESTGQRRHLEGLEVEFFAGDILDQAALQKALAGVDAVVHLAADTRVVESVADPEHNFRVNVAGTFGLLQACRRLGVSRVVGASTGGAIAGEVEPPVHERMPARPISPYGASKLAGEGYFSAFAGSYGMRTLSLRFSNVYGPGSFHKGSVVALFMRRILANRPLVVYGDGSQVRDFLYVGDLVEAIEGCLAGEATGVLQLGSGVPTSINRLLELLRQTVAPEHVLEVEHQEFQPGEVLRNWCDVSEANRRLGFSPRTGLAQGLALTWQWFQSQWGRP